MNSKNEDIYFGYVLPQEIVHTHDYLQNNPSENPKLMGKVNAFYTTLCNKNEKYKALQGPPSRKDIKRLNQLVNRSRLLELRCKEFNLGINLSRPKNTPLTKLAIDGMLGLVESFGYKL